MFDNDANGFEWIDERDYESNVLAFLRKADKDEELLVVCNFSDCLRENYPLGVPKKGSYREIFNSQSEEFGGWGPKNPAVIKSTPKEQHGRKNSISITLPALSVLFFKRA
ncbi:MAG: 1,4-alpha-glucan branching enzyme [Campylobacterota bacterium]|nr:1,4-alpha-glucan branching enzyme [Campylobacterota bacterium]